MRISRIQLEPCDALALGEEPTTREAELDAFLERAIAATTAKKAPAPKSGEPAPDYCKITRQVVGEGI